MRYLARLYAATGEERFRGGVLSRLGFYPCLTVPDGRLVPMSIPNPKPTPPYSRHVTFFPEAMPTAVSLIQDVVSGQFPFDFVDEDYRSSWQRRLRGH